jgi:hypothetical protein
MFDMHAAPGAGAVRVAAASTPGPASGNARISAATIVARKIRFITPLRAGLDDRWNSFMFANKRLRRIRGGLRATRAGRHIAPPLSGVLMHFFIGVKMLY